MAWGNSCTFVSLKKKKKSFSLRVLFGQVEHMFQFDCDLLYLLQLWGRNDFNSLYFEQFHIFKPTTGIIDKYLPPSLQRYITLKHVDAMKSNIPRISPIVTTFVPVTAAKRKKTGKDLPAWCIYILTFCNFLTFFLTWSTLNTLKIFTTATKVEPLHLCYKQILPLLATAVNGL